jgi:4-diphosphocytidyl-2-C-methyl-D-erythritol kinase
MGGGLGGGSSDAASVLLVLNRLWGLGLELDELASLGLQLGADVPVFVRGEAAWGEGVGERLTPVQLPEPWYLVLMPACQVATGDIFCAPELTRDSTPITIRDFLQGNQVNDCLPVVRKNCPEVAAALDWLGRFAPARLTGTGACVFAAFADPERARLPLASLPAHWRGWVTRGRNQSPLHDALRAAAV